MRGRSEEFDEGLEAFGSAGPASAHKTEISDVTVRNWRKTYAGMIQSEMRHLRQLEEENAELTKMLPTCRRPRPCCRMC
ncbi:transposase [Peteryoungia algae]|uniref:transposase n=1 Tax=Peteryoungia algae TaxID=2919917 RepID=UPI00351D4822